MQGSILSPCAQLDFTSMDSVELCISIIVSHQTHLHLKAVIPADLKTQEMIIVIKIMESC